MLNPMYTSLNSTTSRRILLPLPPRKHKQFSETIPATDNTQISIANITKLQFDIRQHEQQISEMKDNLILLLHEHLTCKLTHHSQPLVASFSTAPPLQLNAFLASGHTSQPLVASFSTTPPLQLNAFPASGHISQSLVTSFSTAPPLQLNAFPASGHTSQPLVASSLTAPPPQLTAFPASGHISHPLVASSVSAGHFASQDFNKSAGISTRPQPHNIISQPHAAPEQLATQQQGISQLAQHSATVLNIPAICDSKIQMMQRRFRCVRIPSSHHLLKLSRMNC